MSGLEGYSTDYEKRQARTAEKIRLTLAFLREEYCTSADVIARLLGVEYVQTVYRFLNRQTEKGLLRSADYLVCGNRIRVWGLTPHGLALSFGDEDMPSSARPFQPSKVSAAQLLHRLDIQRLRLAMEAQGATGWRYLHRLALKGIKEPDALAEFGGVTVAFEVERTVKSRRRYQEIVSSYLFGRKAHGIGEIWYVCPDAAVLARVQRMVTGVDEIVNPATGEARRTETLDVARLFAPFRFKLYEEL